jgi:ribosomal protein S18 acetylase RimI-like enzyme
MMTTNGNPPNRQPLDNKAPRQASDARCPVMSEWSVTGRAQLSSEDLRRVDQVRRACESDAPLDLKLELDESDPSGQPIHFLAEAGTELIGYGGITPGAEAEVCGMVLPAWRRKGVGSALLDEVRAAGRRLERETVLVICEDAGPVALAWMRGAGAVDVESERRMTVRPGASASQAAVAPLELRSPTAADRGALLTLLGEGFAETAEQVGERLDSTPQEETLIALDSGAMVGTLRITRTARRSMIYGFVIDSERRGQRLGTRMLAAVFERLRAAGVAEIGLEVDPDNTPAVRLYEAFGFRTVTTYRYLRLRSATNAG